MVWPTGQKFLTSVAQAFQILVATQGPENVALKAKGGTFILNGATPVTVADDAVTANSNIIITLHTAGGTVGAIPVVQTKTAGTGFTVLGTASDTSVYSYLILA